MVFRKSVYCEIMPVAVGEGILSAATVGVFGALGYFTWSVLWSTLTGWLIAVANYFFLGVTVSLASDRAEKGQVAEAEKMIKGSSVVRLAAMSVAVLAAIKTGANPVALLLPLLLIRPILMLAEFFRKKGD